MRRNEVLGLRWDDIDFDRATIALNRGLVSVGYQLHETRGKTRNAPRPVDLDATTLGVLRAWRSWQHAEQHAVGIDGEHCSRRHRETSTGSHFYRLGPVEAPEEDGLTTVEALASESLTPSVAGARAAR